MTPTAAASYTSRPMGWFARAEAWLDDKGKGAWIAAMVLGFIFFWPIGLALVFYITYTNRWSKNMFAKSCRRSSRHHHMAAMTPTGNSAFDAYRVDTLRRLEEEQQNFESFLERLREAKDKAEFDAFMDERATKAAEPKTDA
ncbi:MAG: DUF2852 domain-containing protein [Rhodobacteraceae bacterium]|nr:DUF2852 domain-containing protein [Paracoccaceae bacterium]